MLKKFELILESKLTKLLLENKMVLGIELVGLKGSHTILEIKLESIRFENKKLKKWVFIYTLFYPRKHLQSGHH